MTDESKDRAGAKTRDDGAPETQPAAQRQEGSAASPDQTSRPRDPVRRYTRIVLVLAALLFVWYVAADRVAPWTDQARVDAFVVPITPKVSGKVKKVNVVQDQVVEAGDVLVEIDPREYELAVQRAEATLEIAGQETGADTAAVAAAEASLAEARAQRLKATQDLERIENIFKEDPGAVSKASRDAATATQQSALAKEANALAELQRAKEQLGKGGEDNPRVRDAVATLEQAQIDLAETKLYAPSKGGITNLEVDVGHYAKEGAPLMTFISGSDAWVEAYLRENSLANIQAGDPVDIVLDMAPGKVWKGKVISRGYAVQKPSEGQAGGLVRVQGDSGWLRDAQRFPVVIHFADESASGYRFLGGQADVQIYTESSNALLDALGRFWIRLMSWLSYVY